MQKIKLTPLLKQYFDIKEKHKECLIFFRLGDFYELFFEDAETAASILNITLTKRGNIEGKDIPMCGVPHHQGENYLARLLKKGFKVAICEQMEKPEDSKRRGAKEIIKREVVRIATPGTLTEEKELEEPDNNYLFSFILLDIGIACSWVDISTGEVNLKLCENEDSLISTILNVGPSELLIDNTKDEKNKNFINKIKNIFGAIITGLDKNYYSSEECNKYLRKIYSEELILKKNEVLALGSIIKYIYYTQNGKIPPLLKPYKNANTNYLEIDVSSKNNLEIIKTLKGENKGSLLNSVNNTKTPAGKRMLIKDLLFPLSNVDEINSRLDLVDFFYSNYQQIGTQVIDILKQFPDLARSLARLSLGRGGPRDLYGVLKGLRNARSMLQIIDNTSNVTNTLVFKDFKSSLAERGMLQTEKELNNALAEKLPLLMKEGNFIKKGYSKKLDNIRELRDNRKKVILNIEVEEKTFTNINNLKVKYNNFLGYFIDVTPSHQKIIKNHPERYIHRQTLKNSCRYTTNKLIEVSENILAYNYKFFEIESQIYLDLVKKVIDNTSSIIRVSNIISRLDVSLSWASYARQVGAVRPELSQKGEFNIINGRHPSVEKTHTEKFIPNGCRLTKNDGNIFKLITGPNMSGKSTYLRQNALILIITQAGGFCPAEKALVGICDKLFCRVGSGDELAKGNSTFMVEMIETARILNEATEKSFVILDEIGRGTSTFDGMSIAWAIIEYLILRVKCKTLFSTHYTELSELSKKYQNLELNTFRVKEWKGDLIFLHEIINGIAESSYGIQVAKMAGVPKTVIDSALILLNKLESKKNSSGSSPQLHIKYKNNEENFSKESFLNSLSKELENIEIDKVTPLEALNKLSHLKKILYEKKDK